MVLALYHIIFLEEGFRYLLLRMGFFLVVKYYTPLPFPDHGHHPRKVRCYKV